MNLEDVLRNLPHHEGKLRLLIVDDQPINIRTLNQVFKEEYEVLMATSGAQAIEQAKAQKPDLILLDVVMPDISGHDVCRALKANRETEDIPVIFVTSQTDGTDEAFGFSLGAVDFISKPINPVTVMARVRTQLALKLQLDFMKNMAMVDGLTGVANRRRFDEALNNIWRLCQREERPMSLLMMDIDYFKRFNDQYGHLAGDECLRTVAKALKAEMRRPTDVFCRYGGEEFACILLYTDQAGAVDRARAAINAVHDLKIANGSSEISELVTVSIGVATIVPKRDFEPVHLIQAADKALYEAKVQGRNRYVVSS
ncbi:diguanylate cyclase [Pokkaliibacter sp. MBI-7]|uniref:diguanylate cyclase n=1 Tax=Pokkaliibacter sp. MBI-7 TaxID=3040600 RepID=UPI0024472BD0|nr:diguanylate cyclase [Pokkaliibacter sp. MBI-7]MDH2435259.1 diguanylate cyclase [Pokkaliibacter sp. MBI-7]